MNPFFCENQSIMDRINLDLVRTFISVYIRSKYILIIHFWIRVYISKYQMRFIWFRFRFLSSKDPLDHYWTVKTDRSGSTGRIWMFFIWFEAIPMRQILIFFFVKKLNWDHLAFFYHDSLLSWVIHDLWASMIFTWRMLHTISYQYIWLIKYESSCLNENTN